MKVFYTVNSGVWVESGSDTVVIDMIHQGGEAGFSITPERFWASLKHPVLSVWTHRHSDHFDIEGAKRLVNLSPESKCWAPDYARNTAEMHAACENVLFTRQGKLTVYLIRALHDGIGFEETPLYVPVVTDGIRCCVLASDAVITEKLIQTIRLVCIGKVDDLFVNLYQWGTKEQRKQLLALAPKQIYMYHLPFPADDHLHLRELAQKLVRQVGETTAVRILSPMCAITLPAPTDDGSTCRKEAAYEIP